MAKIVDFFWRNKFNFVSVVLSIFFNLLLWLLLVFKIRPQAEPIFLYYNIYYGIALVGPWWKAYLFLPVSSLIFILFNIVLAYFLSVRDRIISYFLLGLALFSQLVFLVAGFFIVMLNLG